MALLAGRFMSLNSGQMRIVTKYLYCYVLGPRAFASKGLGCSQSRGTNERNVTYRGPENPVGLRRPAQTVTDPKALPRKTRRASSPLLESSLVYIAQQIAQRYAEPGRNGKESFERWNTMASFYEAHGCAMKPAIVREGFLAQTALCPQLAHSFP